MPQLTSVTVADDGATVKVTGLFNSANKEYYFNKRDMRVSGNPDLNTIYIHDESESYTVSFEFADVTSPVEADYDALIAVIQNYLDTIPGGALAAGAATETKQDVIIGHIDGVARVTTFTNTTGSGTVTAGANRVSFMNDGTATGTVKGVNLPKGVSIDFEGQLNDTLDAIAYDATGTTFLISEVR